MDFRTAFLEAAGRCELTAKQKTKLAKVKKNRHPRFWAAAENMAARRYERQMGKKLPEAIDWSSILDWLIANLPTILSILIGLLAIF